MEFRCRNAVDLEPKEPKIDNQCGLSQIDTIRASDIWRGRQRRQAACEFRGCGPFRLQHVPVSLVVPGAIVDPRGCGQAAF